MRIFNKRDFFETSMKYLLDTIPKHVWYSAVDIVYNEFIKFNRTFIEEVSLLEFKENIRNKKYSFIKSSYHENIIEIFSDDKRYIKKFENKKSRYNLYYSSNMYNINLGEKEIMFSPSIIILTRKGKINLMEGVSYLDNSKNCSSFLIVNCNDNSFPMVLIHELSHIIGEQIIELFHENFYKEFLIKSDINHELMAEFITHLVLKNKCKLDDSDIKILIKNASKYVESIRSKTVCENFKLLQEVVEKNIQKDYLNRDLRDE